MFLITVTSSSVTAEAALKLSAPDNQLCLSTANLYWTARLPPMLTLPSIRVLHSPPLLWERMNEERSKLALQNYTFLGCSGLRALFLDGRYQDEISLCSGFDSLL